MCGLFGGCKWNVEVGNLVEFDQEEYVGWQELELSAQPLLVGYRLV